MSSYYISPIAGTGTKTDPYRATLGQYRISFATVIPMDNGTPPKPLFTWCLCALSPFQADGVTPTDTTAIDADATVDKVPIANLDATINSLSQAQKAALQAIGTKYGITSVAGLKNSDTCRTALTDIGRQLDPGFDPGTFAAF